MALRAPSTSHVRRWGPGTAAVVRLLVAADRPLTGVAIAHAVGVTQPRVSQVLRQLAAGDGVRATADGYVGRRARLMELYAQRARPVLIAPETFWYNTRSAVDQARRILANCNQSVAFSSDLGPDLLAPWRHPTIAIVYVASRPEFGTAGLVPAEGRADASVIARWTSDAMLLSPSPGWPQQVDGIPLADPVQQWVDLLELGGDDRREAADRLRRAILDRTIGQAA
ncbi:MAG: hypothetical protein ACYDAD_12325 [Acidimicrobiales bacterium]